MRTMYDSTNINDIPSNASMVAGYVDGLYANVGNLQRRFPHAVVVRIAVSALTNDGHVLDVESGDATPSEAVGWVKRRRIHGADPSVYCNMSVWPNVRKAFHDAGIPEPHYWIAKWDGIATLPTGAVAKQYGNPDVTQRHYDVSCVADYWAGVDAPHNPRPTKTPAYYTVRAGDTLSAIALKYGLSLHHILELNHWIGDPNVIRIGDRVKLSGKDTSPHVTATYRVVTGDSLSSIAAAHHMTLNDLEDLNPQIKDPSRIYPGQTIYL
jgi:LysM repeat protein